MAVVSILRCEDYEYGRVRDAVAQSLANLGGIDKYINPGERVLLKTNLLIKKKPEEAATTHPALVKALASLLIEHGASVVIGDSPGGPFTPMFVNGFYKVCGMEAVAAETGATLNANFKACERENPQGLILKRLTMTDMVNDADKIISVAKLKTHAMMTYTGAAKNMFGLIPGITKAEYHLKIPGYEQFADMLLDVCLCASPVLSFLDGIVSMEGHGPSAGTPVDTQLLLASDSPYHLDQAACHIIGLGTEDVLMLSRARARGLIGELSEITFAGLPLAECARPAFKVVRASSPLNARSSNLPGFAKFLIERFLLSRPLIQKNCLGCGVCKEACPAKVIEIKEGKAAVNHKDCIRCYCCQELCPHRAVKIHKPLMLRLLRL
jgi:uncharacterized protein (DUF362 family)/NAD-dependent dihydropyrimidine dehydrogenase PreA subunit